MGARRPLPSSNGWTHTKYRCVMAARVMMGWVEPEAPAEEAEGSEEATEEADA